MNIRALLSLLVLASAVLATKPALAWEWEGHGQSGWVADRLLAGTKAETKVREILGRDLSLATVADWPDCVRSVRKFGNAFIWPARGIMASEDAACKAFDTPDEVARMIDYARRNWSNCGTGWPACHSTYHSADVALQRDRYRMGDTGTSDHDVVHAVAAALAVLRAPGDNPPAPPPFSIRDKKEALLMLAHFVGDLHSPHRAAALYLSADGKMVDPDMAPGQERMLAARNDIYSEAFGHTLTHEWDQVWRGETTGEELLVEARTIAPTSAPIDALAEIWAGEAILLARLSVEGLTIIPKGYSDFKWTATVADYDGYRKRAREVRFKQVARSGAHLAELLRGIWPD